MVDIKKILKLCTKSEMFDTLGSLYMAYEIEELAIPLEDAPIFESAKETFEELERLMPIWEEKYGFNMDTKIEDVLQKI